ncbi:MAG: hypothetical protein IJV41_09650, partial [Oscillospiraceae bacterium]|nr:hypothetical protein [Oscillospiraceae bacterium]
RRLAAGMAKRRGHLLGKGAPKSENPNITYILCTMFGAMLPTISAEEPIKKKDTVMVNGVVTVVERAMLIDDRL